MIIAILLHLGTTRRTMIHIRTAILRRTAATTPMTEVKAASNGVTMTHMMAQATSSCGALKTFRNLVDGPLAMIPSMRVRQLMQTTG